MISSPAGDCMNVFIALKLFGRKIVFFIILKDEILIP